MRKVIKQETYEVTLTTPDLYTRLEFEDGEIRWVTRFGITHGSMTEYFEEMYKIAVK